MSLALQADSIPAEPQGKPFSFKSSCLFKLYAEYNMWNAELDEAQAGVKITERNTSNFRYADDTTLKEENKEALKTTW